jgi:hypothetical protein
LLLAVRSLSLSLPLRTSPPLVLAPSVRLLNHFNKRDDDSAAVKSGQSVEKTSSRARTDRAYPWIAAATAMSTVPNLRTNSTVPVSLSTYLDPSPRPPLLAVVSLVATYCAQKTDALTNYCAVTTRQSLGLIFRILYINIIWLLCTFQHLVKSNNNPISESNK